MSAPAALGQTIINSGRRLVSETVYRRDLGIAANTLSNIEFILLTKNDFWPWQILVQHHESKIRSITLHLFLFSLTTHSIVINIPGLLWPAPSL